MRDDTPASTTFGISLATVSFISQVPYGICSHRSNALRHAPYEPLSFYKGPSSGEAKLIIEVVPPRIAAFVPLSKSSAVDAKALVI